MSDHQIDPVIHSDATVDLGGEIHGHSVDMRTEAGIGSIVTTHKAFQGMFHATRKAARRTKLVAGRGGRIARQAASDDAGDAASGTGAQAKAQAQRGIHKVASAPGRTRRAYERLQTGEFAAEKRIAFLRGKEVPTEARLPRTIHQRVRGKIGEERRKVGRRIRRRISRRLSRPARTGLGRAVKAGIRGVRHAAAAVRGISMKVVMAPMAGLILAAVIIVVVFSAASAPSGSDCSGAPSTASTGTMDDDYYYGPHGPDPRAADSGSSPMGYEYGNCTDFVAWRINRDDGSTRPPFKHRHELTPNGGNGGQWGNPGNLPGWSTVTSPAMITVGDVISYKPGVNGSNRRFGHVAYVAATNGTGVTTENYGHGRYYQQQLAAGQLQSWMSQGLAVVKHNPKGHAGAATSSASGCDVGGTGAGEADAGPATQDAMDAKKYAMQYLGNDQAKFDAVDHIFTHESSWRWDAYNPQTCGGGNHAYGIPQSCPGSKMASESGDWKTNAKTQVRWGIKYMRSRYGGELQAWQYWQVHQAY